MTAFKTAKERDDRFSPPATLLCSRLPDRPGSERFCRLGQRDIALLQPQSLRYTAINIGRNFVHDSALQQLYGERLVLIGLL